MRLSRDGELIQVGTSDGHVILIEESTNKVLINQKRHNLPITACAFVSNYAVTGSADYTYNFVPYSKSNGLLDFLQDVVQFLINTVLRIVVAYGMLLKTMDYVN